jgi:hypothetical protein
MNGWTRPRCRPCCAWPRLSHDPLHFTVRPTSFASSPTSSVPSRWPFIKISRRHSLPYDLNNDNPPKRRLHPRRTLRLHPLTSSIALPLPHALPISLRLLSRHRSTPPVATRSAVLAAVSVNRTASCRTLSSSRMSTKLLNVPSIATATPTPSLPDNKAITPTAQTKKIDWEIPRKALHSSIGMSRDSHDSLIALGGTTSFLSGRLTASFQVL